MIKQLVTFAIKELVAHPNDVEIRESNVDGKNLLEIVVHEADRGKVIGKEGQTIKAIRMMVNALSADDCRINVDVAK